MNREAGWARYDASQLLGLQDERVRSCYLGKVCFFWQGRNAYFGRWSSTNYGYDSLVRCQLDAEARIKNLRAKGTKWWIEEIPILVLAGSERALLVADCSNDNAPFSSFVLPRRRLNSLLDYAACFERDTHRLICKVDDITPARLPFRRLESVSMNGRASLQWNEEIVEEDLGPAMRIISGVVTRLQRS